jgi:hypothetical protein
MFTFLIISSIADIPSSVYQAFSLIGTPRKEVGARLIVESMSGMRDGWIAFQPIDDVQHDYEIEELDKIKKTIENPSFYLIEGRNGSINFADEFIKKFSSSGKILIDNDHGLIVDLMLVKRNIELGKDWLHLSS